MTQNSIAVKSFYEQFVRGEIRSVFDKIGFLNIGYWKGVDDSVEMAQINLIETLVESMTRIDGKVLDVGCGKGASTKFLTKYFSPKNITGINIAEEQLRICRVWAPECNFELMDATSLRFDDESFDNVICIEASQHFRTRYKFIQEAFRVLKPRGRLVMHDAVFHNLSHVEPPDPEVWPKDNYLPSLEEYRASFLKAGFMHVSVDDITEFSMSSAAKYVIKRSERDFDVGRDYAVFRDANRFLGRDDPWMPGNCSWAITCAIK